MPEQAPNSTSSELHARLDGAIRVAYASPYAGETLATMQEDGVRTVDTRTGQGAETPDADILRKDTGGILAATHEGDKTYLADIPEPDSGLQPKVSVFRPDGSGGRHKTILTGLNAEKAAGLVANRAARRIGSAVIKLDGSMRARNRSEKVSGRAY